MTLVAARYLPCTLACFLALACGGQVDSKGAGGATSGGTGGTAGTSVGGSSGLGGAPSDGITVLDQNDQPVAGAIVVVDRPNGSREENTTNAQGFATFADVDFSSETLDLTAFSPGRALATVLDVGPTSSRILHLRPRVSSAQWTRILKLTFLNKVSTGDCIRVSSTASAPPGTTCGDSLDFPISPDATGQLLALESADSPTGPAPPLKAAVAVDIPSTTDSIEIDLSKSAPIEHASGSIELPKLDSGSNGFLSVGVGSGAASASVSASSPVQNGMLPWQADFFRPFPEAEARTFYQVIGSDYGRALMALVSQAGYFPAGSPPAFPVPASIAEPSPDSLSVFAPLAWTAGAERPDKLTVYAYIDDSLWPVWNIWFSPQRDSVTLRKPPDSIWNALDWKDVAQGVPALGYCDPGPEQCNGSPCTPTDEPQCLRSAQSYGTFFYDLQPP